MVPENSDTRLAAEPPRARPRGSVPADTRGLSTPTHAGRKSVTTTGLQPSPQAALDELAVVAVSHNSLAEIDRCLESALELGCPVFVVDSASTDGSAAHVRETYPAVHVVDLGENRGYGAAANEGVELGTSTYVLVLNADAWPSPGAARALVAAADRAPRTGAIGPRLVYPDGSRQRSVFGFPRNTVALVSLVIAPGLTSRAYELWQAVRGKRDRYGSDGLIHVGPSEFVSGAAMLFRREAFADVGGFDGRFFMYCEEIDLCLRLRRAGWTVAFDADAVFTHVGGASTQRQPERMYGELVQSYLSFIAKHHGLATAERARAMALRALALRSLLPPTSRRRRARAALRRLRSSESRATLQGFAGSAS